MSPDELREIDAEVMRKVFGWDVVWLTDDLGRSPFAFDRSAKRTSSTSPQSEISGGAWQGDWHWGKLDSGDEVELFGQFAPVFSKDIAAAWKVVDRLAAQGWTRFSLECVPSGDWHAIFVRCDVPAGCGEAFGATPAEAIAKASSALKPFETDGE